MIKFWSVGSMMFGICLLVLAFLVPVRPVATLDDPEARLYENLSARFNTLKPPRPNASIPVDVQVAVHIDHIYQLDIKHQILVISGWIRMTWRDESLQWNPLDYGNVDLVVIPSVLVWSPDVFLAEQLESTIFRKKNFNVVLLPNGTIFCDPGGEMTLNCPLNLRQFPFDTQRCNISIITWNSPPNQVLLRPVGVYDDLKEPNDDLDIVDFVMSAETNLNSWATFEVKLRRKSLYHILNVLLPIVSLSILNLMVFRLPPGCGEAVTCSVSIVVAFSVWLLMLSSSMPSTSKNLPLITIYVTASILVSVISTIVVILTIHIYDNSESDPIPAWLTRLCVSLRSNKTNETLTWKETASAIFTCSFLISLTFWLLFTIIIVILFAIG